MVLKQLKHIYNAAQLITYLFHIDRDEFCLGETTFLAVDVGGHEQGMF